MRLPCANRLITFHYYLSHNDLVLTSDQYKQIYRGNAVYQPPMQRAGHHASLKYVIIIIIIMFFFDHQNHLRSGQRGRIIVKYS